MSARRERGRPTGLTVAAAAMVVATVLCFSILDATSKTLTARYPVAFIVWTRYVVQVAVLVLWLGPGIVRDVTRARHHALHLLRGAMLVGSSLFVVLAFRHLPLADATALNYTAPVMVMILAVVALDEQVTRQRIVPVVMGIVGMLLIVRPGTDVFEPAALFALAGAGCYAMYQVLTSKLAGEDARVLLFYGSAVSALVTTCLVPTFDVPASVRGADIAMLIGSGVLGAGGHFLFISALQRAPASTLSPFTYAQLVFATTIGWVLFGQLPDVWTVIGMIVVASSGMLVLWYERRTTLARVTEPPGPE